MDTRKIDLKKKVLLVIIFIGLVLRLKGIENPLLDDQAWRQTDTAGMAVHMEGQLTHYPDVFFPRLSYDGVTAQKAELEFPMFPYLLAWTWAFVGQADLWGRLWAIGFSLMSIWGIYVLGKNLFSENIGLVAAAIYAVLPLSVYYGRVIMPEPLSQTLSIWALNSILWWRLNQDSLKLITAGLVMAFAILSKLPQLMIFPVAILLGFKGFHGKNLSDFKQGIIYSLVALSIPAGYYISAHFESENSSQFVSGIISGQIIKASNRYWEELQKNINSGISNIILILALLGLIILIHNLLFRKTDLIVLVNSSAMILWSVICIVYVIFICAHIPLDYYLVPILPLLSILIGVFVEALGKNYGNLLVPIITTVIVIWLIKEGFIDLSKKYVWNNQYLIQSEWISANTPKDSVLILSDPPPMTFYYSKRVGFRLITSDDESLKKLNELPGDYLVKLPTSVRKGEFWEQINNSFKEIGPGIYKLNKN